MRLMPRLGRTDNRSQRYWDALVSGAPPQDLARLAAMLDPSEIDLMHRMRAARRRRLAEPRFIDELEISVMAAFARAHAQPIPIRGGIGPTPSRSEPTRSTKSITFPDQESNRRWGLAALSTVALIAIVLAAFFFTLRDSSHPAVVPVTPDASPTSAPAPTSSVEPVSMYRGGLERTGEMPGPAPNGQPGVLWRAQTGAPIKGPVVVGNGLVYTGSDDGSVHAHDMETGAEVWKLTGSTTIESPSVVLDGNTAYISGFDGMLLAVEAATGEEIWRTDPALNVSRRVAYDASTQTLYVGGLGPVSYAFDSATGQIKWQVDISAPQASVASIVVHDTVYFGASDGLLYALNAADGTSRWMYDSTLAGFGSLTFASDTLFAPAGPDEDPAFVAVDATTGTEAWRLTTDSGPYSAAAVFGEQVIFGTDTGEIVSVSQADGSVTWTFASGNGAAIWGPPGIVGAEVFVYDIDGWLYAMNAETGVEHWRVRLDGGINYNPAITGGVLYLGTWEGTLYALGDDGEEIPVATPVASPESGADSATSLISGVANIVWESDDADANLLHAHGVAVDPEGNIWVADGANDRFQIFAPDGTLLEVWGEQGTGDGQFDFVSNSGDGVGGVAFRPDGSFYVMDTGNNRIQLFDVERTFLSTWGSPGTGDGQFVFPSGIAIDSQGNLYVSDYARNDIQKFDADGVLLLTIGGASELSKPETPAIASDDSLWIADPNGGQIHHFASDGTHIGSLDFASITGEPEWVQSMTIDDQGHLYLADIDGERLFILDTDGSTLGIWSLLRSDGTANPNSGGLLVTDDGAVYLTDWLNGTLYRYELDPPLAGSGTVTSQSPEAIDDVEQLWQVDGGDAGLGNLAIAPDGTIWVADVVSDGFQIFDADGNFLESWTATGDGQFTFMRPNGDAFNAITFAADGSFFVMDPDGRRIQAFAPDRSFLRSIGETGREPGQFLEPIDIVIDRDGNLAVLDDQRQDIQIFAADGTLVSTIPLPAAVPPGPNMNALAIDADGNFYVAELTEDADPLRLVEKFDAEGNLLQQFGLSDGPGKLMNHPAGVAIDQAGNVYVSEAEPNARVVVFTADGVYLTEFGGPGSTDVTFLSHGDFLLDGQGNAYVTDWGNNRLLKIRLPDSLAPASSALETSGDVELLWETTGGDGGLSMPSLITIAPDGTIWVADGANDRFQIFDSDGNFLESWTGTGEGQFGLQEADGDPVGTVAFAPDASFYVLDPRARKILVFSADRTFLRTIGEPGRGPGQFLAPLGITTDATGNVAVLDAGRGDIQTFTPDGTLVATVVPQATHSDPTTWGFAIVDSDGNVLFPQASPDSLWNPVVEKFDPQGNLLLTIGDAAGPGSFGDSRVSIYHDQPIGIAVDAAGNVYVTEVGTKTRIVVYSPQGEYITEFGGPDSTTVVFEFPLDIALDGEGNLYVTDMLQNRLVKLRLP